MIIIALGIIGMLMLVMAYVPMLVGKLSSNSYKFLFANLFGGACLMLNGFLSGILIAYPILNVIWTFGTLIQICREWRTRHVKKERGDVRCKRKCCCH